MSGTPESAPFKIDTSTAATDTSGTITRTTWDAVTIAWDNGHLATVHHGDMQEIQFASTNVKSV